MKMGELVKWYEENMKDLLNDAVADGVAAPFQMLEPEEAAAQAGAKLDEQLDIASKPEEAAAHAGMWGEKTPTQIMEDVNSALAKCIPVESAQVTNVGFNAQLQAANAEALGYVTLESLEETQKKLDGVQDLYNKAMDASLDTFFEKMATPTIVDCSTELLNKKATAALKKAKADALKKMKATALEPVAAPQPPEPPPLYDIWVKKD